MTTDLEPLSARLRERLRAELESGGVRVNARRMGLDPMTLWRFVKGEGEPSAATLDAVAAFLDAGGVPYYPTLDEARATPKRCDRCGRPFAEWVEGRCPCGGEARATPSGDLAGLREALTEAEGHWYRGQHAGEVAAAVRAALRSVSADSTAGLTPGAVADWMIDHQYADDESRQDIITALTALSDTSGDTA